MKIFYAAAAVFTAVLMVFSGCSNPGGGGGEPQGPAAGTAGISILIDIDGTLITSQPGTTTISKAEGDTLSVEAAAGLTDIQWSLDGTDIPAPSGTARSVSFGALTYPAGKYNLGLRVKKGGVPYSLELEFTVTE